MAKALHDRTLTGRITAPVYSGVMDEAMHILAKQVLFPLIPHQLQKDGIAKGALSISIQAVNRLGHGVQQQANVFLTVPQKLIGTGDIAGHAIDRFANQRKFQNPALPGT